MESTVNLNQRRGGTFFCLSLSAFVSSRCLSGITGVLFTRGSGFVFKVKVLNLDSQNRDLTLQCIDIVEFFFFFS